MKKFRYTVNGKTYSLPESEVAGFLQEFPNAQLIEEISDTAGKQTGVAQKAVTTTPENVTAVGDSSSEAISLVSQPLTRKQLEEQEDKRQAQINAIINATNIGPTAAPKPIKKAALQFIGGASGLVRNIVEYIDAGIQVGGPMASPAAMAAGQAQKIIRSNIEPLEEDQGLIDTSEWKKFNSILTDIGRKYYNDDGSQANTGDLFKQGRLGEMSDKVINEAFTALPSLAVAFTGIGGVTALGASAAGGAFERTMEENPDSSIHTAFLISNVQGGIEAASERIGVKLLKTGRAFAKTGANEQLVREANKSLTRKFLERSFGEGITESAATGVNELIQTAIYDDDITVDDFRNIGRQMVDEFAVGLVLGSGASSITINSGNPTNQNVALHIAPNSVKKKVVDLELKKLDLISQKEISKTKKNKKSLDNEIKGIEEEISISKQNAVDAFNALTTKEKIAYAKAIDNINLGYNTLYNKNYTKTKDQQDSITKQIKSEYKKLEDIAAYEKFGIDIETEQAITKGMKRGSSTIERIKASQRDSNIKDLNVKVLKTEEEVNTYAEQNPKFKTSEGIFIGKTKEGDQAEIVINEPVAITKEQTNVLGHEKLHYLISKYFKTDNASLQPLVDSFKSYLVESGNSNILRRIDQRIKQNYTNKDGTLEEGALEEYFTIFSDIVSKEKVTVKEEGIGAKLANTYNKVLNGLGFGSVKMTNGREVFNFIRNYTSNIRKSDKVLGVKLIAPEAIELVTPSDVVIKKSKSKEIDDAYEAGTPPFDITQLYEPLVNKLVNKYKNVPDFSVLREDLVQNALYEKGGVIDLINSYDGRGTLSGYVGKLLPLRMNKMASDLFGQKFTEDVTERVDVAAQETLPEQVEREETQQQELEVAKTQEKRNILDRANLSSELQLKALNAAKRTLGTILPQIDVQKGKNFREKYKLAVRNMLFEDVSNELRAYSPTDYFGYIDLNAEALYDILPLADLTKSQALKDLFLEQQFDKDGKPVRVLESFTGKKSYAGNLVFKKKPFKDVKQDFLNEFAKKHSNSVQRKAFIINTLAKEIAFDESMEALNDPAVLEKIPLTQDTAVKEFIEEFEKNIQRGRFTKYSRSEALDNWIADSEDFTLLEKINNAFPAITKLMNPTGTFRVNEDPDFGTAFVNYFDIPKKYRADIENDLNNAFRDKIVLSLGTFNLKGAKKGDDPRPLKLGVFGDPVQQDKAYDYVANRLTGDKLAAKSWSTEYGRKRRDNQYHDVFRTFASEYLNNADIKTDALTQNVYKQMVDNDIYNGFAGNIDDFLGFEKGPRGKEEIDGVKRVTAPLSTFAGNLQIKKFGIKEIINDINNGDFSKVDAHNKYVEETIRPQYKRILLSLYDFVENGKGTPNENTRAKFAVRFATMMFKGGNTYTPFRESAFITHVAKEITTPYAEHAKPIEALGEDFMVGQRGDNFLAAFVKGGDKGRKTLERAIDKMFNTNGVFIVDRTQADAIESLHGKVEIPNKEFITSRLKEILNEGDINIVQSGINLTDGNAYDINKGLNADVEKAIVTDKRNNNLLIKFSKSAPAEFSEMLDRKSKDAAVVRSDKDFALAANLGKKANYKNKWNIFLPYSAEDFYGLLQKTAGTGKQGDADLKFIKEKFLDPYDRGISNLEIDRRALLKKYRELKKEIKATPEKLDKNLSSIGLDAFTVEDAVRMFIWKQQGMAVPNISKTNSNKLVNYVEKNSDLRKFAFGLIRANKQDKYPEPDNNWFAGNIGIDLSNSINKNKRSKYLQTWNKNINLILNDKNKTKLTAAFGTDYVKNLESIIARMKSGTNRRVTDSKIVNGTLDFINGSVGTIMFFNMRSASLQLISAANYLNWSDNNPLQAGKALANVPQYTKDLLRLLNSDFLVNRRNGLKINIQEAELADAVKSDNKFKAIMATILKAGFIPTQIADSLAIAGGGATFYRNRLNTYLKEGLSEKNAEAKAYNDWRQIANDSQQSSDASRISNIQASDFGRLVFAFANTPFQYTRLTKKAASDLINNRGDAKTNISKIVYYMAVQNLMFNFLQNALFAAEAEEDETKLQAMLNSDKVPRVINNMSDSVLRGLGFTGAVISMIKNTGLAYYKEKQKDTWRQDSSNVLLAITDISPPLDHKARKVKALMEIGKYENDIPDSVEAVINAASILNVPLDRVQRKLENIQGAMDRDLDNWQRAFMLLGWSDWELEDSKNKKAQRTILKTK